MEKTKRKRIPTVDDTWFIPKGHRLEPYSTFGFKILPSPGTVWKELGDVGRSKSMMMADITKGIKPAQWQTFKNKYHEEAEKLEEKYPNILIQQKWLKTNLTPAQQARVDKWNRVAKLVLNDLDDYTLVKDMSKAERSIVGNHLKMLDMVMPFDSDKIKSIIFPIIEKIKQQRPVLYNLYCHTTLETKGNTLGEWMRDIENKEKHREFIDKAKAGIEYQNMCKEERYSLSSFTRKGTKYPEFKKEIEQMRPDWFDGKLRKRLIRKRHFAKKKAHV